MNTLRVVILVLLSVASLAQAATGDPLDLQQRYRHFYVSYTVHDDATVVESREWSRTILKEAAVDWSKRASVTYSTSVQQAEVIAAYTEKPDGRRIDAPKDNFQVEVNRGKEKDAPVFSDMTTLTVVFPDVAVGDTVVFKYRLTQTEPLFPGHFSVAQTFSKQVAFDDVRVHIEYPAAMWVQYEARGMTEKEASDINGRKVLEWTYSNPRPIKDARQNYSVVDPEQEVGFAFSTFKAYADIAAAYAARALPKATVTERIKNLAAQIVKDKVAPKDQAHALYDWVATNITYAGNCIGVGAVVPHDLSFVLDNKMGDCKDHATLLQALLAARGIKSTQALVNSGSVYRLPKIPVVSMVNHVINYIPSLNLYVDSTSASTPFGMLPFDDEDKPVLLTEGFRDGAKTPVAPIGSNQETTKSLLKVAANGAMSGTVEVFQKGRNAVEMRAWARQLTKDWEEDFVKNAFRSQGMIASGKFEKDDPTALDATYHYKVTFNLDRFIKFPGSGAFYLYPVATSGPIRSVLTYSLEPEKEADVTCSSGVATEEYVIELPKAMKVLSIPDNVKISNEFLSYSATYKLKGNVLTAKRSLVDRTKGNVCSPQVFVAYKKFGEQVIEDLKAQVLYK